MIEPAPSGLDGGSTTRDERVLSRWIVSERARLRRSAIGLAVLALIALGLIAAEVAAAGGAIVLWMLWAVIFVRRLRTYRSITAVGNAWVSGRLTVEPSGDWYTLAATADLTVAGSERHFAKVRWSNGLTPTQSATLDCVVCAEWQTAATVYAISWSGKAIRLR